jgi:ParB/RepB/Spo0J family partition protein
MQNYELVGIGEIYPDPEQPRKHFPEADLVAFAHNVKQYGIRVPVIVYRAEDRYVVVDGERRLRAGKLALISQVPAVVLDERPDTATLACVQASIDAHRASLSPMERSNLLAKIKAEQGWGVTELAQRLSMKQSLVSKLLSYQKLSPEVQELLHAGKLDMEKAFILSQKDAGEQVQLLDGVATLSREQLRGKGKSNGDQPKMKRAVFALASGVSVTLQGAEVSLADAIESLTETLKALKKGLSQGLDIGTVQAVLRDRSKVKV